MKEKYLKSKYRGVGFHKGKWVMRFKMNGQVTHTNHESERKAALAYDRVRIEHGLDPVNILKRV